LLEMTEKIGVELRPPRHPALEEREREAAEPPRHAAHDERSAYGFLRGREVAEVVMDVVHRRHPAAPAVADAVERGGDAQFHALRPDRVVVELALVAQRVDPWAARVVGPPGPRDDAVHHDGLESQLSYRVPQLRH